MKKLLLIPNAIFPYLLFALFIACISFNGPLANVLLIYILVCLMITIALNCVFIFTSKNCPPKKILNSFLLVKGLHIPAYFFILYFSAKIGFTIEFFGPPLIIVLAIVFTITTLLSSMGTIYALAKYEKGAKRVIMIICQCVFFIDSISIWILYDFLFE